MCKVISVTNQKGGVGKTTTSVNLGVGLAKAGKKVLLIDADPSGNLTTHLGINKTALTHCLTYTMVQIISKIPFDVNAGIIQHEEGVSLVPSNSTLAGVDASLIGMQNGRELVLKQYVDSLRPLYDYIIIDTSPTLGMLVINALACADSVLIPSQPAMLSLDSFTDLIETIVNVRKSMNPSLKIAGLLITMMQERTANDQDARTYMHDNFGQFIKVFDFEVPYSTTVKESPKSGSSMFRYAPRHKVTNTYARLAEEVLLSNE